MAALKSLSSKPTIAVVMAFPSADCSFSFSLRCPGFRYNKGITVKPGDLHVVTRLWVLVKPSVLVRVLPLDSSKKEELCLVPSLSIGLF